MSDTQTKHFAPARPVALPDAKVTRYETLPLNEILEELRKAGIDPAPTIAAVKKLVEESLRHSTRLGTAPCPSAAHAATVRRSFSFVATAHYNDDSDHDF